MKALINQHAKENFLIKSPTDSIKNGIASGIEKQIKAWLPFSAFRKLEPGELLTPKALYQLTNGEIPDLWDLFIELYDTFYTNTAPYSGMQFVPALKNLASLNSFEIQKFLNNAETNHVLIHNELFKVVLIHWKPGKYSDIHGHAEGGCVFKVLHGRIEEKRFTPDNTSQLLEVNPLQKDDMAYIDDQMAYHAVGNPFDSSAISLHVYTPGTKNTRTR